MRKYLVFGILIVSILHPGCSTSEKKDAVKVMTLNVRYDNPGDSLNAWPNRISLLRKLIEEEKPDLIGMQEVLWHQYEDLDSLLKGYCSVGVGRDNGARAGEMNPVFYSRDRFDIVRTLTFWLSETPDIPGSKGWGASLPRIVTWVELSGKKDHKHFYFFNTHFAHDSDSARIMSSRILLSEVKKIAEGFPFIVTGDFNMLPYSTAYTILTGPDESAPVLKDTYYIAEEKPVGPTYTYNGFSHRAGTMRVDYLFVKNGIKVLSHATIIKKNNDLFVSDHWPVTSTIILK